VLRIWHSLATRAGKEQSPQLHAVKTFASLVAALVT